MNFGLRTIAEWIEDLNELFGLTDLKKAQSLFEICASVYNYMEY